MTNRVHEFDAHESGSFPISLTYDAQTATGKTTAHIDTYHSPFVKLVPNEQVVEVDEFETTDPAMRGEMTITTSLADLDGGTELTGRKGKTFFYSAGASGEKARIRLFRHLIDQVFGGSAASVVLNLVQAGDLSKKDLDKIRARISGRSIEKDGANK